MKQILLVILAIVAISACTFFIPFKPKFYGDQVFHEEAKVFAQFILGNVSSDQLKITRAPGPVLFYAIPYSVAHSLNDAFLWKWGFVFNLLSLLLATYFIYQSLCLILGKVYLGLFVSVSFIVPVQLYYALSIAAETMAFLGCAMFLYGTVRVIQQEVKKQDYLFFSLGIFLLVAARPNSLILLAFIPLFIIIQYFQNKRQIGFTKPILIAYLASVVLVIGLSFFTKQLPSGQVESTQENLLLYVSHHGRFQFRDETWDWRFWDDATRVNSLDYSNWLHSSDSLQLALSSGNSTFNEVYGQWIVSDILTHPLLFTKQILIRILSGNYLSIGSVNPSQFTILGFSGPIAYYTVHGIINGINLTIIFLGAIGFLQLLRSNKLYIYLVLPYIALLLFHCLIYMEQRYLFPARPIILFFAIYQIHQLIFFRNGLSRTPQ